jgi:hypothetical protein
VGDEENPLLMEVLLYLFVKDFMLGTNSFANSDTTAMFGILPEVRIRILFIPF